MDSGHMALSIYFNWMSSKWGSLLDSQPRQEKYTSVKDYYDQFCTWRNQLEAVNYIGDEEWYVDDFVSGLKIDLMVRVSRHKWIRRLSDALRRAEIEETFLSWEENTVLVDVDEDFEDEIQGAESACGESDDLEVQIEIDPGKTVSPNADHKVFDELSQPNFTTTTSYTMIEEELDVPCVQKSLNRATFDQIFGDSENGALKMFNKLNGLVFTGLNSLPETLIPVEFVMVRNAYQVFVKMPQLSLMWPFEQLNGNKGSIPFIDCVPQVFDPGSVTNEFPFLIFFPRNDREFCKGEILRLIFDPGGHFVCYMGCSSLRPISKKNCALCNFWVDELTSATFQLCVPNPCSRVSSLHRTRYATRHSLEPRKRNSKAIMTVFGPGGILVCYNGCDRFEHHISCHSCKCNGNQNDYDCLFNKLNIELAYIRAMIVIDVTLRVLYVIVGLTREENGSHRSINSWIGIISSWYVHSAAGFCKKKHSRSMMQQSAIYNTEVDQTRLPNQVHHLPYTDVGIHGIQEFGGPFGLVIFSLLHGILIDRGQNDMIWSFHWISRNDWGVKIWCFWDYFEHCVGACLVNLSTVLMINMSRIEPRKQLVGNFSIGMPAGSCRSPERRFPAGYKTVVLLMAIILESFVWDPGLRAYFIFPSHALLVPFRWAFGYCTSLGTRMLLWGGKRRMICMRIGDAIQRGRHYDGMRESMQREYGIMELSRSDEDSHCQLEIEGKDVIVIADFCKEAEDM